MYRRTLHGVSVQPTTLLVRFRTRHPYSRYDARDLLRRRGPLLLGSWLGLGLSAVFILGIAWRAVHEERVLRAELSGYEAYTYRVRYGFIPYVW